MTAILPRIHQMWIAPDAAMPDMPDALKANTEAWAALHPGCAHRVWSLAEVLDLCAVEERADVADAIRLCRFPSMQADIARLFLLLTQGGLWVDLKLRARAALPEAFFRLPTMMAEHFPTPDRPDPAGLIAPGFMAAVPGAPAIATALDLVLRNVAERQGEGVFGATSGAAITRALASLRLSRPEAARAVTIIPHTAVWGGLLDVSPDDPAAAARHWTLRQTREPLFEDPTPPPPPAGSWQAIPGHIVPLPRIVSRQGFHAFEDGPGFAWIEGAARIFFDAPLAFDRMRMKLYVRPGYSLADIALHLNGTPVPATADPIAEGWTTLELGPFTVRPAWNALTLIPQGAATAPGDGRALAVALAWLQPWINI